MMNFKNLNILFSVFILLILSFSLLSVVDATSINEDINSDKNVSEISIDDNINLDKTLNELNINEDTVNNNSIHTITEDNYYDYFKDAGFIDGSNYTYYNSSNLINHNVKVGDTLDLSGEFRNKSFIFTKSLTITSSLNNAYLYDCQIAFLNSNTCSSYISNLNIENHVDEKTAILSMNSSNIIILNNNIFSTGRSAYPIFLSRNTTNSSVLTNIVKTSIGQGGAWQHPGILLGGSDYNYIANNDVTVEDSNGIYLSEYSGGVSHHNMIFNNTVRSSISNPSSWAYGIQLMGDFNTALDNTVIGTYRGISTSGNNNSIINNKIYNVTGAFYEGSSIDKLDGGDYAIYASYNSLVANNSIINSKVAGAAIALCENSTAYGNYIEIISDNYGIRIFGSNCAIYKNNINFLGGTGIYSAIKLDNLKIFDNIINSVSDTNSFSDLGSGKGLGIYINYQSSSKRPTNVFVSNNTIYTSNKVAINLSRCEKSTLIYEDNILYGDVILPEGYNVNGTDTNNTETNTTNSSEDKQSNTYYINENNFNEFIIDGKLSSKIKDGDILVFSNEFSFKGDLIIDKEIKIIGKNAKFYNVSFSINANNVLIESISVDNYYYAPNFWAFKVELANNVTITKCNISVRDENTSYGIYVSDSSNDVFTYNNIKTQGDRLTYSIIGYEFYNSLISNNNITTIGTSKIHAYEGSTYIDNEHIVGEMSKTYGIVLIYSSSNNVLNNSVIVSSDIKKRPNEFNESTNTLIGIDLYYGSDNNIIKGNDIVVKGKDPFIYGMGVVGAIIDEILPGSHNNKFINNNVLLNGTYFASGIIVGNQAINTLLDNNTLNLYSSNYTYGITLEQSQNSTLNSNKINGFGQSNYGIELYSSNHNIIKSNYVYGGGEYAESMGFYDSSYNTVKNNTLISNGTHIHNQTKPNPLNREHVDSVSFGTYGSFINWESSLDDKGYGDMVNFFNALYCKSGDYKSYNFKGVSTDNLAKWFNSLDEDSKNELLNSLKEGISPFSLADGFTEHLQNQYHADAVDLWNIPVWLESGSNNNDFEDNIMVSNNRDTIKGDFDSRFNNFNKNSIYYGVNRFMNSHNSNYNQNSVNGGSNSNSKNPTDIIKNSSKSTSVNGSSNYEGSSLGDSDGLSDFGNLEGETGKSSSVTAYELNSSDLSGKSAYAIPLIILALVILFCYGFLRDEK